MRGSVTDEELGSFRHLVLEQGRILWRDLPWRETRDPYAIWISRYYFKRVAYICPHCHEVFKPALKEAFWASHTPTLRKVTCTCCGYKGFCVETYGKVDEK